MLFWQRGHSCYIRTILSEAGCMETATPTAYSKQGWWVGPDSIFLLAEEEQKSQLTKKKATSFSWRKEQKQTPKSSCKHPYQGKIPTHPCLEACRRGKAAVAAAHHAPPSQPTPQETRAPTWSSCTRAPTGAVRQVACSLTRWVPGAGRHFVQALTWNLC